VIKTLNNEYKVVYLNIKRIKQ